MYVYKGRYGFSTQLKSKDINGDEIKTYFPVRFKKGQEPMGDANIDIKDWFLTCFKTKDGTIKPELMVMDWTERIKEEPKEQKEDRQLTIDPDDLPFY